MHRFFNRTGGRIMQRKLRVLSLLSTAVLSTAIALHVPVSASAAGTTVVQAPASNDIKLTLNGKEYKPKVAPFMERGTMYLPIRDIGELLGTLVSWNAAAKTVSMNYPNLTIKLSYGSMTATVNGKSVALTAPLRSVDGRIFVPLRFFSEAVGVAVDWEDSIKTVSMMKSDDFFKENPWDTVWLNRKTGDLFMARNDQSPAVLIGKLNARIQGDVTIRAGGIHSGDTVLTIVDNYGESHSQFDAYGLLIHDKKIVNQKKASYNQRYEQNVYYTQVYHPNGWLQYTVLTDGRYVTLHNESGQAAKEYNLPNLVGKDDSYAVLALGEDYLIVRPNQTGLLTLIDLKDNSVAVLTDKLLAGADLAYAYSNVVPYHGDELKFAADMGYGQVDFYNDSPLDGKDGNYERLTYIRPSYDDEREAMPKNRSIEALAAACSREAVTSVYMQDGDMLYIPLNGANEDDLESINKVCGILKKFASNGVLETVPKVPDDTFWHGMNIHFVEGDYASMYVAAGNKLVYGSTGGKDSLVLNDSQAVRDFEALKIVPSLAITPNPAHFGDMIHLKGNNGDSKASSELLVYWMPVVSTGNDPKLMIYEGTLSYGRYDVQFAMPAYGVAPDGTRKPIQPGKCYIYVSSSNGGPPYELELLR
jgi:hypothetical protein